MLNLQLAKKYAVAMFELAQEENKLVEYGEQLAEISTLFKTQPELKAFMSNPQIQPSAKKELLNKVFGSDIEKSVHNFMLLLIDKRRIASCSY